MRKNKKLLVLCILVVALGGLVVWNSRGTTEGSLDTSGPPRFVWGPETVGSAVFEVPNGWRTYENTKYHFSFAYPSNLEKKEYDEGGSAMTITFQNIRDAQGFQIFVVPHVGEQITEEQFRRDIPSGVREGLLSATIDGVNGAVFYSKDALLSETYEIWFVRGGYLYEVTTLKPLDKELNAVMQTWEFIE